MGHGRRHIPWFGVTAHPTAEWIANQVTEACGWEQAPRYLIRDRDGAYGEVFIRRLRSIGIRDRPTSPCFTMGPARIYPWRKMHRSRAPSIASGTFFVAQPWADCITNMPGFNLRQAQPQIAAVTGHSLKDVEAILDAHYLGRDIQLAEAAVLKLEKRTKL